MISIVIKFGNRWSSLGSREVEQERVSTGRKRGKVRGVKLDVVEARGGQVGVPICDSTQQEGRGGPAHRVARSFARHCRATLTFWPPQPSFSLGRSLVHRVNLIILLRVWMETNEFGLEGRGREKTRCLRGERKRQRFFRDNMEWNCSNCGNLRNRSLESHKNTLNICSRGWNKINIFYERIILYRVMLQRRVLFLKKEGLNSLIAHLCFLSIY